MPVKLPFWLPARVYHERNLHETALSPGMTNNLQCSAHLLHPNAGKNAAGGLDQKQEHISRWTRLPFHTAVWSSINLYGGAVSQLGCLRLFPASLPLCVVQNFFQLVHHWVP